MIPPVILSKPNDTERTNEKEIRKRGKCLETTIFMCVLCVVLAMGNVIPSPDLPNGLSRLRLWIFLSPFAFYYKEKQQCSILHVKSVHRPVKTRTVQVQKALGVQY